MEKSFREINPHPKFLEILFAHKAKVSPIFKDVIGVQAIHHTAITYIHNHQFITLSSTPALEYNLFSENLWLYDKTYCAKWIMTKSMARWETLYDYERYDELYYLKQISHCYSLGISLAEQAGNDYIVYSIASRNNNQDTQKLFNCDTADLYKIGQYCSKLLMPMMEEIIVE